MKNQIVYRHHGRVFTASVPPSLPDKPDSLADYAVRWLNHTVMEHCAVLEFNPDAMPRIVRVVSHGGKILWRSK